MTASPDITEQKRLLRKRAIAVRAMVGDAGTRAGAEAIAATGLGYLDLPPGTVISAFASMPGELDTGPLLQRLHADGLRLALPVMQGKARPLVFRAWAPGDEMAAGLWDILEPLNSAAVVQPDVVLTPLLAFDARGYRIGYGGGFYDRTLEQLRAQKPVIAVGLAYDEQRVDDVPHDGYDQRLDWVLTPSGPQRCDG